MTEQAPGDPGQAQPPADGATPPPANPFDTLDEDARAFVDNKGWSDVGAMLTSYQNLEKLHGVGPDKLIKMPDDPAQMGDVWNRLGRPEEAAGYTLALPEEMKDGVFDQMATKAHEAGLTDAQFQAMQAGYKDVVEAVRTEQGEAVGAALEAWKQSNQADFHNVRNLMSAVGISEDDMANAMNGDATAFYSTLAKVASKMGEGSLVEGDGDAPAFRMTPAMAKQKLAQLEGDDQFMHRLLEHPDKSVREAAAAERRPLMQIIADAEAEGSPSDFQALQAENERLKAQLRSQQAGGF